jgi:hypothetical protein
MSLAVNVDDVVAVLLTDGWHEVHGRTFDIDAYEYMAGAERLIGFEPESGITYMGFVFMDSQGDRLVGPVTAIHAVRVRESSA